MKRVLNVVIFLSLLPLIAVSQVTDQQTPPADDLPFNLLLLGILALFFCAMIGAAIVGAAVAALVLFFLMALVTLGLLSTSVLVGLYKRSFQAGFKTFLYTLFGGSCSLIGGGGLWIAGQLVDLPLTPAYHIVIGGVAGLLGGILMALATHQVLRFIFKSFAQKLPV
jgi:hypothetical protein